MNNEPVLGFVAFSRSPSNSKSAIDGRSRRFPTMGRHNRGHSGGAPAMALDPANPETTRRTFVEGATTRATESLVLDRGLTTTVSPRSVQSIEQWPAIPVWPLWGGGRVVPMSPNPYTADPFLLMAHHKHSFNPKDILRGPFKAVGKALGLPYVDVEGFSEHPHRGMDILTYILDGSDGFRHKDSLGGATTYRGGSAQFMRTARGVLHEEFWETRPDRTTRIELFQIWMNLPRRQKFQPPAIRYLGQDWQAPFEEEKEVDENGVSTKVRVVLDESILQRATEGEGDLVDKRPVVRLLHAWLQPGAIWRPKVPSDQTAWLYVREGSVIARNATGRNASEPETSPIKARSSALFQHDGNTIVLTNPSGSSVTDALLLIGEPLREPVAMGGPIVMNTQADIEQAYREIRDGTFLAKR